MTTAWLSLAGGLIILTLGAEGLVRGGAGLALRLGLTPLVIGLTVVAFGTSSPEMVVSLQAARAGEAAIAIGNVVGSNICNIALILGLCALLRPLHAQRAIIRREVPILIGISVLGGALLLDGGLTRIEGVALFTLLLVYTVYTVRAARKETQAAGDEFAASMPKQQSLVLASVLTLAGLGLLIWGADLFVTGAVAIATAWGWSELVIGLTVVAVGTSLPELATSIVATIKGEVDVAIGNIVGSNIFNLLGILGISATINPLHAPDLQLADLGLMLALPLLLIPILRTGGRISRFEGGFLFAVYAGYTAWMIMR